MAGAGAALLGRLSALPVAAQDIPREKSSATVTGKLSILQAADFHPDHNAFLKAEMEAYCQLNGWAYEITDVAGYQGGGDLNQKLVASVQAGNAADLLIHDHTVHQMQYLGVLEPTTELTEEMIGLNGDTTPTMTTNTFFEDQWWGVPFFTRSNGWWVRQDILTEAGINLDTDLNTLDQRREGALKVSNPDGQMWGWGATINRSGDGAALVQNAIYAFGGHLQDEAGQIVTFNSPETVAGLEWLKVTFSDPAWAPMFPPGLLSWTDPSNNEAFLAGTIAMTQNAGTMYAKAVLEKVPFAGQIAWLSYPVRISDGALLDQMGGTKHHVIAGTKNKDATYDLIRHLLTQPVQDRIWTISQGYALPAYKNGWSSEIVQSVENSKRCEPAAWNESGFTGMQWPGPLTSAVDAISGGTYYTDMVAEVLQGKPAEEVVADYTTKFVQIFQDFGFQGE